MSRPNSTFWERAERVERLPFRLRVVALSEAILHGSPDEVDRLAPILLELAVSPLSESNDLAVSVGPWKWLRRWSLRRRARRADEAIGWLVRSWHRLPPALRRAGVAIGRGRWKRAVESAQTSPSSLVRQSVAELLRDAGDLDLSAAAQGLLADPEPEVSRLGEAALVALALHAAAARTRCVPGADAVQSMHRLGLETITPDEREAMLGVGLGGDVRGSLSSLAVAIGRACTTLSEHRRRGVLIGAFVLLDRDAVRFGSKEIADDGSALASWFNTADEESLAAIRTTLVSTRLPLARLRALEWLTRTPLAQAAAQRLLRARSPIEHELVLAASHLSLHPARTRRLSRLKYRVREAEGQQDVRVPRLPEDGPVPRPSVARELSLEARRGIPRWAACLGGDARALGAALEGVQADPDAITRHAVVRAMPLAGLEDLALDPDPRIASSAAIRWSERGCGRHSSNEDSGPRRTFAAILARSSHAVVRRIGAEDGEQSDPLTLSGRASVEAWRLALRRPEVLERDLTLALSGADVGARERAVMAVRKLGLCDRFAPALIEASAHPSPRLAASAAAALADVAGSDAGSVLERLSESTEARVRANAVEALGRRRRILGDRSRDDLLIELKSDSQHRVRGNAMRAEFMLGVPPGGAESLSGMLSDPRPMHRLAAVWVASRILPGSGRTCLGERWAELSSRIIDLARRDDDPLVRCRAAHLALRLDGELRAAWQRNVPWQSLGAVAVREAVA